MGNHDYDERGNSTFGLSKTRWQRIILDYDGFARLLSQKRILETIIASFSSTATHHTSVLNSLNVLLHIKSTSYAFQVIQHILQPLDVGIFGSLGHSTAMRLMLGRAPTLTKMFQKATLPPLPTGTSSCAYREEY